MRDWSNHRCGLNDVPVSPPVSDMGDFSRLLLMGAFMGGVDFQYCILRWLVAPECRRFLCVRRPVSGRIGVYPFPPFGLGPPPSRNDYRVTEILGISRLQIPSLEIIDFVSDWRLADVAGAHDE